MNRSVSSLLLAGCVLFPCEPSHCTHSLAVKTVSLALLFYSLSVFLCMPRRPDMFFQGRLVDRQHTGSLLELMTLSWSRKPLHLERAQSLRVKDLPALLPEFGTQHLSQQHSQIAGPNGRLAFKLAKMYARPLLLQWSFAVLQSFVKLMPQMVTYRLLQWLNSDMKSSFGYGISLAGLLGLSKVSEVLVAAWLKWITTSMIRLPIQATMSALVYQKALVLPNGMNDSDESGSKRPQLARVRMYA